jgi:hypothetical protein
MNPQCPDCGHHMSWHTPKCIVNVAETGVKLCDCNPVHATPAAEVRDMTAAELEAVIGQDLYLAQPEPTAESAEQGKFCNSCKRTLPLAAFNKRSNRPSGVMSQCKDCTNARVQEYRLTPAGAESNRRRVATYAQTEGGKEFRKRHDEKIDPLKTQARKAARNAVAGGKLVKTACYCGEAQTDGHHLLGYDKANWLAVVWLCRTHHLEAHYQQNLVLATAKAEGRREGAEQFADWLEADYGLDVSDQFMKWRDTPDEA